MVEKRGGLAGRSGRRCVVSYNDPSAGAAYIEVPGISNFSIGVGEAPSDTTAAFEGSYSVLGEPPIGDVNFTVVSYLPNHKAWQDIDRAFGDGSTFNWRIDTPVRAILAETTGDNKASIAANTGQLTIAGDMAPWLDARIQRGMSLIIGDTKYTIRSIGVNDAGTALVPAETIVDPAAAVAASLYAIELPALRWSFAGGVKQSGSVDGGVDTAIGSTLVVTPSVRIALPTVI